MQSFDLLDSDLVVPMAEGLGAQPSAEPALLDRQLVSRLLLILSPRQERVVRLCYGIGGPPAAVGDIADEFGLTRSRIDSLRKDALGRMARAAARIDDAEPGMIADRKYPLPRAWAIVDSEMVNNLFVKRLSEARNHVSSTHLAYAERSTITRQCATHRARSPESSLREFAASPAPTTRRPSGVTDLLVLLCYTLVLPIGAAAIIGGARFGSLGALIAGLVAMAIVALAFEHHSASRRI